VELSGNDVDTITVVCDPSAVVTNTINNAFQKTSYNKLI